MTLVTVVVVVPVGPVLDGRGVPMSYVERQGYIREQRRGHPTATANGKVFVHRANLYDHLGPGEQSCHWCDLPIRWDVDRWDPNYLVTDHLDSVRDNNDISNLVPSCRSCNLKRRQWTKGRRSR